MSGSSDESGKKGPRSPADMVSTMPLEIASLRERIERLDAQLSGVDSDLERIAGDDPDATEEITMSPAERARIAGASSALDDTDTRIPVVDDGAQALAEVDALLGEFTGGDALPELGPPELSGPGLGHRPTMPELPVSPPESSDEAANDLARPQPGDAPARQGEREQGGAFGRLVLVVLLAGGGWFGWQSMQDAPVEPGATPPSSTLPTRTETPTPSPSAAPSLKTSKASAGARPEGGGSAETMERGSKPKAAPDIRDSAEAVGEGKADAEEPPDPAPSVSEAIPLPSVSGAVPPLSPPAVKRTLEAEVPGASKAGGALEKVEAAPPSAVAGSPQKVAAVVAQPAPAKAPMKGEAGDERAPGADSERLKSAVPEGELIDAMEAIRADPAPREIIRGIHYFVSNEDKHYLWRERITDIGGIMIGVGAEQNYLLAGWARPEVLVLMDFDIYITWLHKAYRVAFAMAKSPDELITLWRDDAGRERLKAGIVKVYGETGEVQDILRAVKFAKAVGRHLAKLQAKYAKAGIPSFLTDQEQYDFIAKLWERGRVLAIRGDLTGKRTMVDLAAFSRITELPVRVLYTSNAEFYFRFSAGRFRDNIVGLPFDARSLVLRTDPHSGTKYRFYTQKGADFVAWLERGRASNIAGMGKYRTRRDDVDDFDLDKLPEQVGRAK